MATTQRQLREQAAVREKILHAARELFVAHGYEAVSLRKIAGSIGYTAPALYTHFPDKSALMIELCRRDFAALAATCARLSSVPDPIRRIARCGMAYMRFAVEHPQHYRLMFMTPPPPDVSPEPEDLERMGDPSQNGYAFLLAAVRDGISARKFAPGHTDADLITQVLWAGVHGVASLEITHRADACIPWKSFERRARLMIASQLRGLITPAAAKEAGL